MRWSQFDSKPAEDNMLLFSLVLLVAGLRVNADGSSGKLSARERQISECLTHRGWSEQEIRDFRERVLDPDHRSGTVTRADQESVAGCISRDDFLSFGITPEGYSITTYAPFPVVYSKSVIEKNVMRCLRNRGISDSMIRAWYSRVLGSGARHGWVSNQDRHMANGCMSASQFANLRVRPDAYAVFRTHTTQNPDLITASSAREKKIFDCLQSMAWSAQRVKSWYDRVLNPASSRGRATLFDQDMVRGCVDHSDFLYYGVVPDGYSATRQAAAPVSSVTSTRNASSD